MIEAYDPNIKVSRVVSGKLRRYHHLTALQHLTMPKTVLLNIRDVFLTATGVVQSLAKLILWRPDVVFTKGGYVCLPIGFAAHVLRIPLVIHDSDAHPGLTNRILARWASSIATGAPLEYYPYPKSKSHYVGIPVASEFHLYDDAQKRLFKEEVGVEADRPLVLITGGGLGATRINNAVVDQIETLSSASSVILISGQGNYDELKSRAPDNSRTFQLLPFVSGNMHAYLAAADVVVARAGATTLLELAGLQSAVVLVPNGKLTGGHQLKNAKVYEDADAVVVVDDESLEDHPEALSKAVLGLLDDPSRIEALSNNIGKLASPEAAKDVAELIVKAYKSKRSQDN